MISVCIATYNGEKYILEQLYSILKQISTDDEIIISDDNSTDKTIFFINSLKDSRIKIFFNEESKKGYTHNFENALNNANGDFIFLADQDDVWVENKVQRIVSMLEHYDFVASDAQFADLNLNLFGETYFHRRNGGKSSFFSNLIKLRFLGCCLAFKKVVLEKALPFPKNKVLCPHDFWISLIGTYFFKSIALNDPLVIYRRHSDNVSQGGSKSKTSLFFKIKFRLYAFVNIIKRI